MERVAEGPPYNVFIKTIGFRGAILAERVLHEGREVADPDPPRVSPRPRPSKPSCPFGWALGTCPACPYAGCPMR